MMRAGVSSSRSRARRWRVSVAGLATLACLTVFGSLASGQQSDFGIAVFDGSVTDESGSAFTQAGGHPRRASTSFDLNLATDEDGVLQPEGSMLRNVDVELPPGIVGNPTVAPVCQVDQLMEVRDLENLCAVDSIVGTAIVRWVENEDVVPVPTPVHNMDPPPGVPARFGFTIFAFSQRVPVFLDAHVRSDGDYGLTISVRNASQARTVVGTTVALWGVPADPSHDAQRCALYPDPLPQPCPGPPGTPLGPNPAGVPERAFLTNPTKCTEPSVGLETTIRAESWNQPADVAEASFESHLPPHYPAPQEEWGPPQGPTGCEDVPFNPQVSVRPLSSVADQPTGLEFELTLPQHGLENPDGLATAHLKRTEVTLPEGMSISPSSANGLASCSPEQIGLVSTDPIRFDDEAERCPDASKIGTVEIETPLLDDPLEGSAYIAEQDNNPFESTFALYLVASGSGVIVKLPGEISPDPDTGRVIATFDDNPQLPFERLRVRLKGGQRAPLVNPPTCGEKTVEVEMSPWSAADPDNPTEDEIAARTDSFEIDSAPGELDCAAAEAERSFDLEMNAGVMNPVAGSTSPFVLQLKRPDGHQEIDSMEVTPPEGVAAFLTGIPFCEDANAEAGTCPEASKVGRSVVGTGAGQSSYYVDGGEVFLTGPYDPDGAGGEPEAPLGLAIEVPAVAGPFDLGVVNVRAAIHVDPATAQLRVVSDPIPQILEGVPLRIRDIRVLIDRERFTVAPTDCTETAVEALVHGSHGAETEVSERFQVGGCAGLDFEPGFEFAVANDAQTQRFAHPELKAIVSPREGEANMASAEVTLPPGMLLDSANTGNTCTRERFAAGDCPPESVLGSAIAESPLLDDPLEGLVYLITSDNPLPDMVADLDGIVDIDLFGRIHGEGGRVHNSFDVVPDVPVSRFELTIDGGPDGILANEGADLCQHPRRRTIDIDVVAQNGKASEQTARIPSPRCWNRQADKLERQARALRRKAAQLRRRARRAARNDKPARARRLRRQAQRRIRVSRVKMERARELRRRADEFGSE